MAYKSCNSRLKIEQKSLLTAVFDNAGLYNLQKCESANSHIPCTAATQLQYNVSAVLKCRRCLCGLI